MEQPLVATAAPGGSCFAAVTVAGIVPADPDLLFKVSATAGARLGACCLGYAAVAVRHARFQGPLSLARQCHESRSPPALQVFSDPARAGKGVFSDVKVRWGLRRLCLLLPGVMGCPAGPPVAQDPAPAATQACKEVGRSKLRLTGQQGHLTDSVELEQVARVNVRRLPFLFPMHLTRVAGVKHRQPRSRCLRAVPQASALQQRAHPAANRSIPPGAAPAG